MIKEKKKPKDQKNPMSPFPGQNDPLDDVKDKKINKKFEFDDPLDDVK